MDIASYIKGPCFDGKGAFCGGVQAPKWRTNKFQVIYNMFLFISILLEEILLQSVWEKIISPDSITIHVIPNLNFRGEQGPFPLVPNHIQTFREFHSSVSAFPSLPNIPNVRIGIKGPTNITNTFLGLGPLWGPNTDSQGIWLEDSVGTDRYEAWKRKRGNPCQRWCFSTNPSDLLGSGRCWLPSFPFLGEPGGWFPEVLGVNFFRLCC